MTKDEIIKLAREAGVRDDGYRFEFSEFRYLERFFQAAYAAGAHPSTLLHLTRQPGTVGDFERRKTTMTLTQQFKRMTRRLTLVEIPKALRLADEMESNGEYMSAAAKLRRLHELNQELLAALKALHRYDNMDAQEQIETTRAVKAAIAKGEQK
jgi:hypothetical protein